MYDEFSTVYIDYLANYQTGVTRPAQPKTPGKVITRWQGKSDVSETNHNVFDYKYYERTLMSPWNNSLK